MGTLPASHTRPDESWLSWQQALAISSWQRQPCGQSGLDFQKHT
jgi:hypothetical protein